MTQEEKGKIDMVCIDCLPDSMDSSYFTSGSHVYLLWIHSLQDLMRAAFKGEVEDVKVKFSVLHQCNRIKQITIDV